MRRSVADFSSNYVSSVMHNFQLNTVRIWCVTHCSLVRYSFKPALSAHLVCTEITKSGSRNRSIQRTS